MLYFTIFVIKRKLCFIFIKFTYLNYNKSEMELILYLSINTMNKYKLVFS